MKLNLQFRQQIMNIGNWLVAEFDNLIAGIRAAWLVEHTEDDGHGDITAHSLDLTQNTNKHWTGSITGDGTIVLDGQIHSFGGGFLIDALPGFCLIQLGSIVTGVNAHAAFGLEFGPSYSGLLIGAGGTNSFKIRDQEHDTMIPLLELGYSSGEGMYQLRGNQANSKQITIGTKADALGSQGIEYVATKIGFHERARQTPLGVWEDYTPVWSATGVAPALGNGTLTGRSTRVGDTVLYEIVLNAGTTTTFGTGTWLFTLPYTKRNDAYAQIGGSGWLASDSSAGASYVGLNSYNTTQVAPLSPTAPAAVITNVAPFVWATGDSLSIAGSYEEA